MPSNLSKRLLTISNQVTGNYDHIWDTCCDHGLLGFHLLETQPNSVIHFLDQVPAITAEITDNLLQRPDICEDRWKVHTLDCKNLNFLSTKDKHLIIISGVGGELAADIVQVITKNHANQRLEFILCTVHHTHLLRDILLTLNFRLINEEIIEDNKRHYEVIHVSVNNEEIEESSQDLSTTGNMWDKSNVSHLTYLKKLIRHYKMKSVGGCKKSTEALKDYLQLMEK